MRHVPPVRAQLRSLPAFFRFPVAQILALTGPLHIVRNVLIVYRYNAIKSDVLRCWLVLSGCDTLIWPLTPFWRSILCTAQMDFLVESRTSNFCFQIWTLICTSLWRSICVSRFSFPPSIAMSWPSRCFILVRFIHSHGSLLVIDRWRDDSISPLFSDGGSLVLVGTLQVSSKNMGRLREGYDVVRGLLFHNHATVCSHFCDSSVFRLT